MAVSPLSKTVYNNATGNRFLVVAFAASRISAVTSTTPAAFAAHDPARRLDTIQSLPIRSTPARPPSGHSLLNPISGSPAPAVRLALERPPICLAAAFLMNYATHRRWCCRRCCCANSKTGPAAEVKAVEAAGARALHLDVMDGNFVPNITYGMPIIEAVRRVTDLPIDVHMMVAKPAAFVDEIIDAGADIVTIHAEATDDPRPILEQIRSRGVCASLAINPPTPIEAIADALPLCDMVLCMSVMPGFGAQAFESVALDKLRSGRFAAIRCCWRSTAA